MKQIYLSVLLMCMGMSLAQAGVRIESVTRNIASGKEGAAQIMYVQGGALRVETSNGEIMLFNNDTMYLIDNADRSYRSIDKATMEQLALTLGAAMQQMQAQLAKLPPEQRAQMEQLLGSRLGGAAAQKPDVYESVDTGRSDSVDGRACRTWQIKRNGMIDSEVCVVPYASLGGKEDIQALLRRMAEMFESLTKALPQAAASVTGAMHAYTRINGYPVRSRGFTAGKPDGDEEVLKSWKEQAVPATMFEPPAGYKRINLADELK